MKKLISILLFTFVFLMVGYAKGQDTRQVKSNSREGKILVVHAYNPEIAGVKRKMAGLTEILENEGIEYEIIYMDTRRNPSESYKRNAAIIAQKKIEEYKPDVVITFEDNAFKYLVMSHYKDAELPFVFAGIDWDVSVYGAPYSNTTGMISVDLATQMLKYARSYTHGDKITWLGLDTLTSRKEVAAYRDILGIQMSVQYVRSFSEFKKEFVRLQTETDIIILNSNLSSIEDWDFNQASEFVLKNIKIPVGTVSEPLMCCSVLGLVKVDSEQGRWAAETALAIIAGKALSMIPIVRNKEGKILINLDIAERLNIAFDWKILKNVHVYQKNK